MNLTSSTAMRDFIANMRLVRDFGDHAIAMRPIWQRHDELLAKCDAGDITATEAIELLQMEKPA
jgi:hypothetical protein